MLAQISNPLEPSSERMLIFISNSKEAERLQEIVRHMVTYRKDESFRQNPKLTSSLTILIVKPCVTGADIADTHFSEMMHKNLENN